MRTSKLILAILIPLLLLLSGCSLSRKATNKGDRSGVALSERAFLDQYLAKTPPQCVQATGTLTARLGDDGMRVPVRYSLDRSAGLVLSLRPLPFVEAGRIDVDRETLLVQDRINRRYFRISHTSQGLRHATSAMIGLDPTLLRAIALCEPFTRREVGATVLRHMKMHYGEDGQYIFENKKEGVRHEFDHELRLTRSLLSQHKGWHAEVIYADYSETGVPQSTRVAITLSDDRTFCLDLKLNKLSYQATTTADTTPTEGYREIGIKELIEILKNL